MNNSRDRQIEWKYVPTCNLVLLWWLLLSQALLKQRARRCPHETGNDALCHLTLFLHVDCCPFQSRLTSFCHCLLFTHPKPKPKMLEPSLTQTVMNLIGKSL
ncbi:hypothetical protein BC830DRAFT_458287 [Chytriomyces sp. MP71]|nr:hypothetical protein BC830DRAFT_458287 [Chytriomyces sp. MP71]